MNALDAVAVGFENAVSEGSEVVQCGMKRRLRERIEQVAESFLGVAVEWFVILGR